MISIDLFRICCCLDIPSIVLALIGICATLIVGVSVYDSYTIHNIQRRIEEMRRIQNELEKKEQNIVKENNELKNSMYIANQLSWGLALMNLLPYTSFRYCFKGLLKALETNNTKATNNCLKCMNETNKLLKHKKNDKEVIKDSAKYKELPIIPEKIKALSLFKLVEERLNDIINEFINLK